MSEPSPIVLSAPDAGNRSAGEALRLAREAQGMTLERLAATIKVTPAKLAALEQGQYDQLPDASFTRALAMTVCRALKLDPSAVLASLPAAKPMSLATGKPPLNQPFKESKGGSPLFDRQLDWSSALSFKWLAPAALLLGAVAIYVMPDSVDVPAWVQHLTQAASPHPAGVSASAAPVPAIVQALPASEPDLAASEAASAPILPVAPVPASGVVPLRLDAADAGGAAASSPTQAASPTVAVVADPRLVNPSKALSASTPTISVANANPLVLSVKDASWIEVKDAKGIKLLSRHVLAGEMISLDGVAPLRVLVGNATGVQLNYRGQPVDLVASTRNNVARLELK